jgi:hypothetical protein
VTEQQLARMAKRRLAILRHAEEITGNVSLTCRYYGSSRRCFDAWKRRYDAHGLDGLRDRSHRPQISPNATRTQVVGKILYLRQPYHSAHVWGVAALSAGLWRRDDDQHPAGLQRQSQSRPWLGAERTHLPGGHHPRGRGMADRPVSG